MKIKSSRLPKPSRQTNLKYSRSKSSIALTALFVSLNLGLFSACEKEDGYGAGNTNQTQFDSPTSDTQPSQLNPGIQDKLNWGQYVNSPTSGVMSKRKNAKIRFVYDIVKENDVGSSANDLIQISPSCEFTSRFSDQNEIEIIAAEGFKPGEHYEIKLDGKKLSGIPEKLGDFKFNFSIIPADFDITVEGLVIKNNGGYILKGKVQTSDYTDSSKIQDSVKAKQGDRFLKIAWTHSKDRQKHEFTVSEIKGSKKDEKIRLLWDGDGLGIDQKGQREIEVPAEGPMTIIGDARSESDQQSVKIYFSQTLANSQDLTGLVTVNGKAASVSSVANIMTIYPKNRITGKAQVKIYRGIKAKNGKKLADEFNKEFQFKQPNPGVKFIGKGVILPDYKKTLTVPFEAANIDSVQVTALEVFDRNIGQFLQNNTLDGNSGLDRVGRFLWRKTIHFKKKIPNQWNQYSLDLTELLKEKKGTLFRISLSINRGNSTVECSDSENAIPPIKEAPAISSIDGQYRSYSNWDSVTSPEAVLIMAYR